MPTRSWVIPGVWFALLLVAGAASAEAPNLGKPVGTADIAAWDISIQPNGTGLPPGARLETYAELPRHALKLTDRRRPLIAIFSQHRDWLAAKQDLLGKQLRCLVGLGKRGARPLLGRLRACVPRRVCSGTNTKLSTHGSAPSP